MSANDNNAGDRDAARDGDIALQDLDDEHVTQTRGNRGPLLESSSSTRVTPPLPASAVGEVLGYLHGMMGQTPIPPPGTMGQTPIPPRTLGLLPVVTAVSLPSPAAGVSAAGVSPGVSPGEVDDGPDHSEWSNDHHLRKEEGDDAEEFGSVPILEEGMYYPSSSDDDDPVHLLDLDPTPAELIAELLRGRVVYGEDGKPLDPERIMPAM
jgi:hypothetical protein